VENQQQSQQHLAAIDLGSNSFHMVVARIEDGHIHILDNLKEMVRLGAGLDESGKLSKEARTRALSCLRRFGERVNDFPQGSVAAVGTKTLRQAKNARQFLQNGSEVLGHPISVIGGKEEARLVYLGVSHSLVAEDGKRFVMDIGGGSTELIIGENFEPQHLRSLNMGCVSMSREFFQNGKLEKKYWKKAGIVAHLKLRPRRSYSRPSRKAPSDTCMVSIFSASKVAMRMARPPAKTGWRSLFKPGRSRDCKLPALIIISRIPYKLANVML